MRRSLLWAALAAPAAHGFVRHGAPPLAARRPALAYTALDAEEDVGPRMFPAWNAGDDVVRGFFDRDDGAAAPAPPPADDADSPPNIDPWNPFYAPATSR